MSAAEYAVLRWIMTGRWYASLDSRLLCWVSGWLLELVDADRRRAAVGDARIDMASMHVVASTYRHCDLMIS